MIRHYNKSNRFDTILLIYQLEPFINQVISIRYLKKGNPVVIGKSNKPRVIGDLVPKSMQNCPGGCRRITWCK
jgi:hypothetical protein